MRSIEFDQKRQAQFFGLLIASALILAVLLPLCFYVDLAIAHRMGYQQLPGEVRVLLASAEVFGHTYCIAFILLTIWWSAPQHRKKIKAVVGMMVLCGVVVFCLKNCVLRIRPRMGVSEEFASIWQSFQGLNPILTRFDPSMTFQSHLQSFPSGHTASAISLAVGLSLMFPGGRYMFFIASACAAAQRVGYNAHYLSDVLGGTICGLVCSAAFLKTRWARNAFFESEINDYSIVKFSSKEKAASPHSACAA